MAEEKQEGQDKQQTQDVSKTIIIILVAALVLTLIAVFALAAALVFGDRDSSSEVATLPPSFITAVPTSGVPGTGPVPTSVPPTVIVPTPEPSEPTATVIAPAGVNVRTGPGTVYDILGVAPFGTSGKVAGISPDGTWYAVQLPGGGIGWVAGEYVAVENVQSVPVLPAPPTPTPAVLPTPTATPAPNITFTASRTDIVAGETALLTWSVENVQAVYMFPVGADFNNYPITGQGSQEVQPFITSTYVLLVFNTDGSTSSQSIEIRVNAGLTSSRWLMQAYKDANGALVSAIPGTAVTARFESNGSLTGFAGCNSYSGGFTAYDQVLLVSGLASSQSACENPPGVMNQEAAFLANLQSAARFAISGNELSVLDAAGTTILSFIRG